MFTILYIQGLKCGSCSIKIREVLNKFAENGEIGELEINIDEKNLSFSYHGRVPLQEFVGLLNQELESFNYKLTENYEVESAKDNVKSSEYLIAFGLSLIVLLLFYNLQKTGLISFGSQSVMSSLLVGVVASVSTCLAVTGGLILSLSAKVAQDDKKNYKVFIWFHLARIISFTVLGGLLGWIGQSLAINYKISAVLTLIAALIMLVLAFNLLDLTKRKLTFKMPAKWLETTKKIEHTTWAPIVLGAVTFLLPCGFTQAMQVQALASQSSITGATIMFLFALGTLPVLGLISFSAYSFANSKYAGIFFKSAGFIVGLLGLLSIIAASKALGLINPLFL